MKDRRQTDRLLEDVLGEAFPPELRGALFDRTLRAVRYRRRIKQAKRGLLSAVLILGGLLAARWSVGWKPFETATTRFHKISTHPLDRSSIVETRAGAARIVATISSEVAQVRTTPGRGPFKEFSDAELLGFLAGKPVALVSPAPHRAELIFLNPADAEGFSVP